MMRKCDMTAKGCVLIHAIQAFAGEKRIRQRQPAKEESAATGNVVAKAWLTAKRKRK